MQPLIHQHNIYLYITEGLADLGCRKGADEPLNF